MAYPLSDEIITKLFLLEHPAESRDGCVVPEKFKQIYSTIAPHVKTSDVPWGMILPERLAEKYNKDLEIFADRIQFLRQNSPYVTDVFEPTQHVLFDSANAFQPVLVNEKLFERYRSEYQSGIVSSFQPGSDGYANSPRYSRVSSSTGRLTVERGPNILNLKKQYRNMLVSRWGASGAILGLDYQALEPSLLLHINNSDLLRLFHVPGNTRLRRGAGGGSSVKRTSRKVLRAEGIDNREPYLEIINKAGLIEPWTRSGNVGTDGLRSIIKKITVSRMNGMQSQGIAGQIKSKLKSCSSVFIDELVGKVDEVLGLDKVFNRLYAEWTQENGCKFTVNFYGRPIACDSDSLLINRFFQSSAVDLAMLGFANIVSYLNDTIPDPEEFAANTLVPLFLLHDMIVFDVNIGQGATGLTAINSLARIGSNDLLGFEDGSFKLRQASFIPET